MAVTFLTVLDTRVCIPWHRIWFVFKLYWCNTFLTAVQRCSPIWNLSCQNCHCFYSSWARSVSSVLPLLISIGKLNPKSWFLILKPTPTPGLPSEYVKRVITISSGGGLSINGNHIYCGDYIFSGHTMTLTMGYLAIKQCKYHHSS